MLGLNQKLKDLHSNGKSIRVAICGIGQMGKSLISQIRDMEGMEVVAVANRNAGTITERLKPLEFPQGKVEVIPGNGGKLTDRIKRKAALASSERRTIFTDNLKLLATLDHADVIMDATGNTQAGAELSLAAIEAKKHVVTLNVEADVTIGSQLKRMADEAKVVYTVAAGDEPGALKELYDFAAALGLEVVAAGKGKNNPLDKAANPTTLAGYSREKGANPRMMTSFVDGTKSMEEMACFSNATGIRADVRGMHGPRVNVSELARLFSRREQGGILNRVPAVDFAIGDVAPGVFLVYTTRNQLVRDELKYLLCGDGPNYLLYRPYHLASIETPISVAGAYFYNEPTIAPMGAPVSEVITVAKKDLAKGDTIDGIGGYTVYGLIEQYQVARKENLLPLGMSEGAALTRDVARGQPITYDMVELVKGTTLFKLRKMQEEIYG
ncbi:MAG: NAD(P)H-dependent oxidoreductase [Actinomycetota bacterium]